MSRGPVMPAPWPFPLQPLPPPPNPALHRFLCLLPAQTKGLVLVRLVEPKLWPLTARAACETVQPLR